jgi:hypothetical protein
MSPWYLAIKHRDRRTADVITVHMGAFTMVLVLEVQHLGFRGGKTSFLLPKEKNNKAKIGRRRVGFVPVSQREQDDEGDNRAAGISCGAREFQKGVHKLLLTPCFGLRLSGFNPCGRDRHGGVTCVTFLRFLRHSLPPCHLDHTEKD